MPTAIFPGSFDPFTIGHANIVERALTLVDRLVIAVGVNERKHYTMTTEERLRTIAKIYEKEPRIKIVAYSDLTTDLAKREKAQMIIKGVRSVKDFEYEREQADINRMISGIETILLCADPTLSCISSSMVRELNHFGKDTSKYLPIVDEWTSRRVDE